MNKQGVEGLQNKYSNKRIFVIGNGPSLNNTPLNMLINEYSIAMNRIAMMYPSTKWRPNFFVCTTTNIKYPSWRKDIMSTIDLGIETFIWDKLFALVGERENVHYLNCTHGKEVTNNPPLNWWSNDISKRVCKYATSMLVALQISVYLGFKEIYILGADLDFSRSLPQKLLNDSRISKLLRAVGVNQIMREALSSRFDKNHFSSSYGTPGSPSNMLNKNMISAHRLAKAASEEIGVKIYNATIGGKLEVYPRSKLSDVLSSSPKK